MGKHDHASCEHEVRWCRHCDVAYCQNCDMQWIKAPLQAARPPYGVYYNSGGTAPSVLDPLKILPLQVTHNHS